tara:strand:+ start:132 stop:350 length:219 start_codon:yes stop_codon:yes gene_type:complete
MQYNIGDLVKWYVDYADGIVRDAGIGVIVGEGQLAGFEFKEVYRFKKQDIERFLDSGLQAIGEMKCQTQQNQ